MDRTDYRSHVDNLKAKWKAMKASCASAWNRLTVVFTRLTN